MSSHSRQYVSILSPSSWLFDVPPQRNRKQFMTQKNHEHKHSNTHNQQKSSAGAGIHRDWRFWGVIAMLAAIVFYVLSMDESLEPEGDGPQVPAADAL